MERYSISKYPLDNYYQLIDTFKNKVLCVGNYYQCLEKFKILIK